jgi:hypothetical protein
MQLVYSVVLLLLPGLAYSTTNASRDLMPQRGTLCAEMRLCQPKHAVSNAVAQC